MDSKLYIKEYCKYIMPFFNGYGAAVHEITGEKFGCEPLAIDHAFGADEGLAPFVSLGSIEEAQRRSLKNKQPELSNEYNFHIASKNAFRGKVNITEVRTNKPYKIFRVFWDLAFGCLREVKYLWFWISPAMYSANHKDVQHSLLKIDYPTKKLVFKVIFHRFYPIDNNPALVIVRENGKERKVGVLKRVNFNKEQLGINIEPRGAFKCYKVVINNPKIGQTYKVMWKIEFKMLTKYLKYVK